MSLQTLKKTLFALSVAAVLALTPNVASAQRFHGGGWQGGGWRGGGWGWPGNRYWSWSGARQRGGVGPRLGLGTWLGVLPDTLRGTVARSGVGSGRVGVARRPSERLLVNSNGASSRRF